MDYILPVGIRNSSLILLPSRSIGLRIRPQQIYRYALVRNIQRFDNFGNLVNSIELWTESSMHAKYFLFDYGYQRHHVECFIEYFPVLCADFVFALFVETE